MASSFQLDQAQVRPAEVVPGAQQLFAELDGYQSPVEERDGRFRSSPGSAGRICCHT
jgi:hypothetical protein